MAAPTEAREIIPAPKSVEVPYNEPGIHYLPLDAINVLIQPRQTFDDIEDIAESIAIHNILNPINVVELDKTGARKHLNTVNSIWETNYKIDDLVANGNGKKKYYILIAGERRFRAHMLIAQNWQNYGTETARRIAEERTIETRLMRNYTSLGALQVQAIENTHKSVPAEEEAMFYDKLFAEMKDKDPSLTIKDFAKKVGRSADKISQALRFAKLPKDIRKHVKQGNIPYGAAIEIQRLREALDLPDEDLTYWVARASVHKKVDDFRKIVSAIIAERGSDQTVLGIFNDAQEKDMKKDRIRQTAAREFIHGAYDHINYMERIRQLLEQGRLGIKDSQYSTRSPLRIVERHLDQLELLMPFLQDLQSEVDLQRTQNAIITGRKILSELIPQAPDDPLLPESMVIFPTQG